MRYHSAPTVSSDDPNLVGPGRVLGDRFEVLRLLGEGGMGRVFLAHDRERDIEVAIKLLSDDRPIPKAAERFEREANAIARIEHDNVVRVDFVGESPRGGLYYVMEYLQGEELGELLDREGQLPWARVRHIVLQICGALQAAHECGVVHRDLKLENCFRVPRDGDEDFIKIFDFGVAKLLRPDEEEQSDRLTNTGATLGTPAYMAPEQCRGKGIDHRVDVYALGVMLYELSTGELPFNGEGFLEVALLHMHEPPPLLSEHLLPSEIPNGLDRVIERALAKARDDRFPTMAAFARALGEVGECATRASSPFIREDHGRPMVGRGGTVPALDAIDSAVTASTSIAPDPDDAEDSARSGLIRGAIAALVVVAVVLGISVAWWWQYTGVEPEPGPETVAAASEESPVVEPHVEPAPMRGSEGGVTGSEAGTSGSEDGTTGVEGTTAEQPPSTQVAPRRKVLTRVQINAGFRQMGPRLRTCIGDLTGGKDGDRLDMVFRVDRASGKVVSVEARARGTTTTAVEGCVEEVVRKARFDRVGQGIQTISRPLTLRTY